VRRKVDSLIDAGPRAVVHCFQRRRGRRLQLQATLSLPIHNQLLKALMKD
jgi:hypothetical protein